MIQFDDHIFQLGWFNHQLVNAGKIWFSYGPLKTGKVLNYTPNIGE